MANARSIASASDRHPEARRAADRAYATAWLANDPEAVMATLTEDPELTLVESDDGKMDESLTRRLIETARGITEETGAFWTDQLNNADQVAGYQKLGAEIWEQTGGELDAFVHGVGTAGSLMGTATELRERGDVRIVAVEPAESAVLSGRPTGAHRIEGVGAGFVVPLLGDILRMPGLPRQPQAHDIDLVDGEIVGLK